MSNTMPDESVETTGERSDNGFLARAELATTGNAPNRRVFRAFFSNVIAAKSGCWLWDGPNNGGGYGVFRGRPAHRWSYRWFVAEFASTLEIDHLCRVRNCVNPAHLEPVTRSENRQRAMAARTHCRHGHPRIPENLVMHSAGLGRKSEICKPCLDRSNADSRARSNVRGR